MKKKIIIFIFIFCIIFTSCNNKEESSDNNFHKNTNKEIIEMKNYKKTIENVTFNTKIHIGVKDKITEDSFVTTTASMVKSDGDKLFKTLFSDIELKEKSIDKNGINFLGQPSVFTNFIGKDQSSLIFNDTLSCMFFNKKEFIKYIDRSFNFLENSSDYNANKYSLDKNLPFSTREEAFKNIKSTLSSVGFDIGDNYKAYALDYKTLKNEEHVIDMDGNEDKSQYKKSWTEDDNCYYFIIRPTFKGIPELYKYTHGQNKKFQDYNAPIQILYSKNGIQFIDIQSIFSINPNGEKVTLASFDKIAETVSKPYNKMIGDNDYEVTDATLLYLVDSTITTGKYPVNLVWVLNVKDLKNHNPQFSNIEVIIDAVTGKEIYNE